MPAGEGEGHGDDGFANGDGGHDDKNQEGFGAHAEEREEDQDTEGAEAEPQFAVVGDVLPQLRGTEKTEGSTGKHAQRDNRQLDFVGQRQIGSHDALPDPGPFSGPNRIISVPSMSPRCNPAWT